MLSFIIGRMNSSISIQLLICYLLIFLPSYCRGYDDPCKSRDPRVFSKLCGKVLAPNYEDWYKNLTIGVIEEEIRKNMDRIQYNRFTEDYIVSQISDHLKIGSSPFRGQLIDSSLSKDANLEYRNAELLVAVSRSIMSSYCPTYHYTRAISVQQCAEDLSKVEVSKTSLRDMCSEYFNERQCIEKDLKYRSIYGSCNNLIHSYLGKATTAYKRLLFPDYVDGIQEVSERLPNARKVSVGLVCDEESFDNKKTMAMAIWGIFIGHDLSRTAVSTMGNNNTFVRCCGDNGLIHYTMNKYVKSCNPITIPNDDAFYEPKLQSCMDYVRSVPAMRSDCTFGHIDQMNLATHYLDGSMIYGTTEEQTLSLRTMKGGQLKVVDVVVNLYVSPDDLYTKYPVPKTEKHLHYMESESVECQHGNGTCFKAGDVRANAHPQLAALYTLWIRQHNRIAEELQSHNEFLTDEELFQEARKIVVAYIQHITYSEWLPALLGVDYITNTELDMMHHRHSLYIKEADPSVSNSFATAILPFAYSMLSDNIILYSENRRVNGSLSLKEHYNSPLYSVMNYTDQLIRGLTTQNAQKVDMLFTETLTNYLYNTHPANLFGMDFISLAIQQSRDHGIPSYTEFRKYCELKDIKSIKDLSKIMVEGSVDKLMKQYKTWDDIDLLIGALLEKHADGAMVGPTMRCIIGEQFVRTRVADRYFYDTNEFSQTQLAIIKSLTLAKFFCDNSNNVTIMQEQAFLTLSKSNQMKNCSSFPEFSLQNWMELI